MLVLATAMPICAEEKTTIQFHAALNIDYRHYANAMAPNGRPLAAGADGFLLRQVRPYVEGTVGGLVDFRLMPDFAGGKTELQDAYVRLRLNPSLNLTVGKFKSPIGLERLQGDTDTQFIERALPDKLLPKRDIGLQLAGELFGKRVTYQLAYFDHNNDKDSVLRVFSRPVRGLGVGIGASTTNQHGTEGGTGAKTQSLLGSYRTNGQQTFFSYRGETTPVLAWGKRQRLSPQAYYYNGSFGLLTEYVEVRQGVRRVIGVTTRESTVNHSAWQFQFSWLVTGEEAGYRASAPRRPYVFGGSGWGSLELAARYAALNVDNTTFAGGAQSFANPLGSANEAEALTLGVNWGLTRNFKVLLNYERTTFTGGAAGGVDAPTENLILARFQFHY